MHRGVSSEGTRWRFGPRAAAALVAALLAFPAAASAKDPLLSGYGGPGSGEQAVLGSQLLPAKGGGGGGTKGGTGASGLRATTTAAAAATPSLAPTPSPQGTKSAAAKRRAQQAAKRRAAANRDGKTSSSGHPTTTSSSAAATATAVGPAGAPPVIAYPSSARSAGGLPLSAGDLAFLAIAALVLALVGGMLRRLVSPRRLPDGSGAAS
jgi:hypothetical protein